MEFNIVNHTYPEGMTSYNVVAEIPGSDKADEVVMLGGHLDSWHAATGATDNAAGSSIMLEAARLIQVLGLKPRRTIRVALWSGEEEGLLGSLAYVKQHFGTFENQKPEFDKLDCYFNVDSGTGRIRGGSIFGPPEAAAVLRPLLLQFKEWGVGGINVTSSRNTGGTDSTSFNHAGLPGVGFQQDPIEYNALTHHTNLTPTSALFRTMYTRRRRLWRRRCGMWPIAMRWSRGSPRRRCRLPWKCGRRVG